jgi:nicotinamidase-related amidase
MAEGWQDGTREFYAERGIGVRIGFGESPAIVVVDMTKAFTDPAYAVGCVQTETLAAIAELLGAARRRDVPVFFTQIAYLPDGSDGGWFVKKVPALMELQLSDPNCLEIDEAVAPVEGEVVFCKKYPSAFFQTHLASMLTSRGIDTLIVTGCSTSGCVRATAVDGISSGYRVVIPEQAVGDRAPGPHEANLFDLGTKSADVLPLADVIAYIDALPASRGSREEAPHLTGYAAATR